MAQKNNSITFKSVITGLFIAMAVFTVAMITVTIVKMNKAKNELNINPDEVNLVQLETIKGNIADDALVAIVETDIGEIRAELYPQYAPNTVANFKKLADSEYYNGTFIYEIKKEMYTSGGSLFNDGGLPDGYDEETEKIEPEFSNDLWPFKGCFMSCGLTRGSFWSNMPVIYSGSRFMIAGTIDFNEEIKEELYEGKENLNTVIEDAFVEYGGLPNASRQMTVFAQTYEGMDVLEKILNSEASEENLRPVEDIEIKKITVCTYKESLEK
ncbi:MAG: peptidylprolyl isomerase [Oscillospiraceae bacterium]|nr:peptidylprolyl isomerase [Oscillospiraceae bacterium]